MGTALPLTLCSVLAAAALVVRGGRARAWLLLGALVVAPAILIVHVWDADQVVSLRDRPSLAAAAALAGLVAIAALAFVFARVSWAFPIAAVASVPFRVPIAVGGTSANLLLPLYLVVAAGALAWALPRITGRVEDPPERAGGLEWALAATLVLYAAQAEYSADTGRALENVVFFYIPFAVLFALMARLDWTTPPCGALRRGADRPGLRAGGDRLRRVRHPPPVPQPEGHRVQPARGLLPGQLAVLRPEHLRPVPGDRARPDRRLDALGAQRPPGRVGVTRRGVHLRRARADAVAVELRGPARRPRGAGRAALERALVARRRGGRRDRRRSPSWRSAPAAPPRTRRRAGAPT